MLQVEHSAILSTFIRLPFSIKTFVLSIFKWPLKTGFTVYLRNMGIHFLNEPVHDILVDGQLSSRSIGVNYGLTLHPHPYFVNATSEGSDETAQ